MAITVLLARTFAEGRKLVSESPGAYDLVVTPRMRNSARGMSVARVYVDPRAMGMSGFEDVLASLRIGMCTTPGADVRTLGG